MEHFSSMVLVDLLIDDHNKNDFNLALMTLFQCADMAIKLLHYQQCYKSTNFIFFANIVPCKSISSTLDDICDSVDNIMQNFLPN